MVRVGLGQGKQRHYMYTYSTSADSIVVQSSFSIVAFVVQLDHHAPIDQFFTCTKGVSCLDPTLSRGKGSADHWVFSWLCRVSSLYSEQANEIALCHICVQTSQSRDQGDLWTAKSQQSERAAAIWPLTLKNQVIKSLRSLRSLRREQSNFLPIKKLDRGHKRFYRRHMSDNPLVKYNVMILPRGCQFYSCTECWSAVWEWNRHSYSK